MKRNQRNPFGLSARELRLLAKVAKLCGGTAEAVALHLRAAQLAHERDGVARPSADPLRAALARIAKTIQINA